MKFREGVLTLLICLLVLNTSSVLAQGMQGMETVTAAEWNGTPPPPPPPPAPVCTDFTDEELDEFGSLFVGANGQSIFGNMGVRGCITTAEGEPFSSDYEGLIYIEWQHYGNSLPWLEDWCLCFVKYADGLGGALDPREIVGFGVSWHH